MRDLALRRPFFRAIRGSESSGYLGDLLVLQVYCIADSLAAMVCLGDMMVLQLFCWWEGDWPPMLGMFHHHHHNSNTTS